MYRTSLLFLVLLIPQFALAQEAGQLKDNMVCQAEPGQSYALYVPKAYKFANPAGVVLLFDPGARGKMPVELYQKLADKYHVILACSNNSHNGPVEQSLFSGNAVLDDVKARFNVDKTFILSSGFSGGGRTAVQMAIKRSIITGVITCGAALPSQNPIPKGKTIPFAEVIGNLDMNYQESLTANTYLKSIANPSSLTFFYGGHQWPPVDAYEEALAWHYVRIKKLKSAELFSNNMKNVKVQLDSGYLYEANRMLSQMRNDFSESKQVTTIDSMIGIVQKDKRLKAETKDVGKANAKELSMQREFQANYNSHMAYGAPDSAYHADYWKNYRRDCDKMLASNHYDKLAGLRLIDFGWRMCAEQHYIYLDYGQYRQAAMAAKIWSLLMPQQPGPCVQAAKAMALQKRKPETFEYLRMAVARGLKDKQSVRSDPAFADYAAGKDFQDILK